MQLKCNYLAMSSGSESKITEFEEETYVVPDIIEQLSAQFGFVSLLINDRGENQSVRGYIETYHIVIVSL